MYDLVKVGDWVTFSKYGVDGDVLSIDLTTVKVKNFDKTISTVPAIAFVSESFVNWRVWMIPELVESSEILILTSHRYGI